MDDVLRDQILTVRDTGLVNMFDIKGVRQVAEAFEFDELLDYLDEDTAGYVELSYTENDELWKRLLNGGLFFLHFLE